MQDVLDFILTGLLRQHTAVPRRLFSASAAESRSATQVAPLEISDS